MLGSSNKSRAETSLDGEGRQSAANAPRHCGSRFWDFTEQHYAVSQIAELWNLSHDVVRRLFEREPGVW